MTTYEKELTVLQNRRSRVRVPVPLPKKLNKMSKLEKPRLGAFSFWCLEGAIRFIIDINRYFCMNTRMRLVALILILIAPTWAMANQYICIPEETSGFYYNKEVKAWLPSIMNPTGAKYLVSLKDKNVKEFGQEDPIYEKCFQDILAFKTLGSASVFVCEDYPQSSGTFQMNLQSLKFLQTKTHFDYIMEFEKKTDTLGTPTMSIGLCTKF